MSKEITVVVPMFNEADNIRPLYERVRQVFEGLGEGYAYHLLFVDDGSTDESLMRARALSQSDQAVTTISLSRNFGKEAALTAGIARATGAAVVLMDADLQHPPAVISQFVAAWERGADVVVGVRKHNPDEGFLRKTSSQLFSYIMSKMSDVPSVRGATDFRLLDRAVVEAFNAFTEHSRMTRGLIDWLGFKREYIAFDADKRHAGVAQYSSRKLIELAFSALVSHSLIPLRLAGYLGVGITLFAGSLGLFIIIEQIVMGDPLGIDFTGPAMLAILILFLNGILLISMGLMSVYIAKIHGETLNRPLFVVRSERASERRGEDTPPHVS